MSRPKKRTVKIRLAGNSKDDPRRILQAVEDVFRPTNVEVQVGESQTDDGPEAQTLPDVANEQLETEVRTRVGKHLERKSRQIAAQRQRGGQQADARMPESPAEIVEKRHSLGEKITIIRKAGWRLTVRVAWETVKELAFDSVF